MEIIQRVFKWKNVGLFLSLLYPGTSGSGERKIAVESRSLDKEVSEIKAEKQQITTDPKGMLKTAQGSFSYIYPLLARQIIKDYGITTGKCLDIGAGPGLLGIEMAKQSRLQVTSLDISEEMGRIAADLAARYGVQERLKIVNADVQAMPFKDNTFGIVVSRGSFIFWEDKVKAFQEIERVLKPGGIAFVGGGDGRLWPDGIKDKLKKIKFNLKIPFRNQFSGWWKKHWFSQEYWEKVLAEAEIQNFRFVDRHFWIEITK